MGRVELLFVFVSLLLVVVLLLRSERRVILFEARVHAA